tara:strand:- start:49671 stop:50072 length:402 start_codon:yes stop_codon:yes gene_type:complete
VANAIYPKYKEAAIGGGANTNLLTESVIVSLVDTATYTYSAAHEFISEVAGITANSAALGTKTVTSGTFDAANVTFTAVSGVQSEALIFWTQSEADATSRLVAYIDTSVTNLPVTPNGGNIDINWNVDGIFVI